MVACLMCLSVACALSSFLACVTRSFCLEREHIHVFCLSLCIFLSPNKYMYLFSLSLSNYMYLFSLSLSTFMRSACLIVVAICRLRFCACPVSSRRSADQASGDVILSVRSLLCLRHWTVSLRVDSSHSAQEKGSLRSRLQGNNLRSILPDTSDFHTARPLESVHKLEGVFVLTAVILIPGAWVPRLRAARHVRVLIDPEDPDESSRMLIWSHT